MQEIVDELKKQRTSIRSPSAIRRKMLTMKQPYDSASTWLKRVGKLKLYLRGKVDEKVERSVLHQCPMYRELTPVFQLTDKGGDDEEQDDEYGAEDDSEASDGSVDEEPEPASAQGKRKWTSTVPEVAEVRSNVVKRGKQGGPQPQPVEDSSPTMEEMIASQPTQITSGNQALGAIEWGSVQHWNQFYGVKYTASLNGDEMARQLFQREMKHTEALAKLQLEEERKRQEVYMNCAKTLSRHKLRSAGVSEEEMDSIIPE